MNKVTFGFKNVHIAFKDTEMEEQPAWKTPIKIPGAVSFSAKPEGEATPFYADDIIYFVSSANNGYSGELGIFHIPDEIKAEMLGWTIDDNGTIVEVANGKPKKFAIMGEVSGDVKNRRFVYYDVQADRPENNVKSKGESIEPEAETMPVKIMPIEIGDKNVVKGTMELNDTNDIAFNAFFDSVYTPIFGTPEA